MPVEETLGAYLSRRVHGRLRKGPSVESMKKSLSNPENSDIDPDERIQLWRAVAQGPDENFLIRDFPPGSVTALSACGMAKEFYESRGMFARDVPQKALDAIRKYEIEVCGFAPYELNDKLVRSYAFGDDKSGFLVKLRVGPIPVNVPLVLTGEVWGLERLLR